MRNIRKNIRKEAKKMITSDLQFVLDGCAPDNEVRIFVEGNDIAGETMKAVNAISIRRIADGEDNCLLIIARE